MIMWSCKSLYKLGGEAPQIISSRIMPQKEPEALRVRTGMLIVLSFFTVVME